MSADEGRAGDALGAFRPERAGLVRRRRRWPRRVMLASLAMVAAFLALPIGRYLVRAGWEEARILLRRERIETLVADSATAPAVRSRLRLVLDARRFAADSIGLKTGESFTTYSQLDGDTLVLVLSGAWRDTLRPYTWWFPIVGRVPYKGFFDFGAARAAADDLAARGFDTYLRPAAAFSTLGWFNDPLLSTTLRLDTLDLANTVIHEVTHNTFYAKGEAVFNESFANFVGARGAAWFFRSRGQPAAAARVDDEWADEKRVAAYWARLYAAIDSAFAAHPGDREARLASRDTVYARARRELVEEIAPSLRTYPRGWAERVRLDNAALLARRIYQTDLEVFDRVHEREGSELRRTIARVTALARDADDPSAALRRWLGEEPAGPRDLLP